MLRACSGRRKFCTIFTRSPHSLIFETMFGTTCPRSRMVGHWADCRGNGRSTAPWLFRTTQFLHDFYGVTALCNIDTMFGMTNLRSRMVGHWAEVAWLSSFHDWMRQLLGKRKWSALPLDAEENIIGCLWVSDKSALSDDPRWIEEALAWNPRLFRQAFFHRKSYWALLPQIAPHKNVKHSAPHTKISCSCSHCS